MLTLLHQSQEFRIGVCAVGTVTQSNNCFSANSRNPNIQALQDSSFCIPFGGAKIGRPSFPRKETPPKTDGFHVNLLFMVSAKWGLRALRVASVCFGKHIMFFFDAAFKLTLPSGWLVFGRASTTILVSDSVRTLTPAFQGKNMFVEHEQQIKRLGFSLNSRDFSLRRLAGALQPARESIFEPFIFARDEETSRASGKLSFQSWVFPLETSWWTHTIPS